MNEYLLNAAKVINDPEQTSLAKDIATEVLRNAGLSDADIAELINSDDDNLMSDHMIFLA